MMPPYQEVEVKGKKGSLIRNGGRTGKVAEEGKGYGGVGREVEGKEGRWKGKQVEMKVRLRWRGKDR